jgi:hypothetical protein
VRDNGAGELSRLFDGRERVLVGPRNDVRAAVDGRSVRQAKDWELLLPAELSEFWPTAGGEQSEQNTSSGDDLVEIVSCRAKRALRTLASVGW